jgi:lysophospholipase L1-like esterase
VTCTATDALGRQASCNFNVTIAAIPSISKTRFLAFGDSITFGRCGPGGQECPADAYPVRLATLLAERYTNQTFTVANVGIPGEVASNTIADELGALAGQDRLPAELEPDRVLRAYGDRP